MTVFILDELKVAPGRMPAVRSLLADHYLPSAAARGMTLERACITPPIELDDEPTTVLLWWSLADDAAFWAMKRRASNDPEVLSFWKQMDALVEARTRRMLGPIQLSSSP